MVLKGQPLRKKKSSCPLWTALLTRPSLKYTHSSPWATQMNLWQRSGTEGKEAKREEERTEEQKRGEWIRASCSSTTDPGEKNILLIPSFTSQRGGGGKPEKKMTKYTKMLGLASKQNDGGKRH